MKDAVHSLLVMQGYSEADICDCRNISALARWTPSACALLGALGLMLRSPGYMLALGCLTLIGAFGSRSFYDYVYVLLVRRFLDWGEMPLHGKPRRFGCGIGAGMFALSGIGLFGGNPRLTYLPGCAIVFLALIAAVTQWCFASALYSFFSGSHCPSSE